MERGRRLDLAWAEEAPLLSLQDRGWVHEAVYGTVRFRARLDYLLNLHLRKGIDSLPAPLLPVLRLAAHQIVHMGGTPAYAAVSQAVEQTRRLGYPRLSGVVNGVLRSLARQGGDVSRFPSLAEDPVGHLTHWGSHPRWLVKRWIDAHGLEAAAALVEASNRIPITYLRPLGGSPVEAAAELVSAGIVAEPGPPGSGTVRLEPGSSPEAALRVVGGIIQDPAAAWVVTWCGDVEGLRVLDLCAAPGGKALALVAAGARVTGADLSARRLALVAESAGRLGLSLPLVQSSAEAPPFAPADLVLLDAPCSGTGTLARHPDGRWRLSEADISVLSRVQERLMDGAASVVKPGGLLVYSTCTMEPEENDAQVESFLGRHDDFMVEVGAGVPADFVRDDVLKVFPGALGTDGSFAARLRRR